MLGETALSPLESTALGVTVRAQTDATSPGVLGLTVDIDAHDARLAELDGRWVGSIDFLFAQISPDGRMLKGLTQPLSLRLSEQEYQEILRKGISISGRLGLVSGADRLRVVVRENTSGATGSIDINLSRYSSTAKRKAGE